MSDPVRYAVVGLGYISQVAMLPAFRGARRNSRLAAILSSSRHKLETLGKRYRVARRLHYEAYDELLHSGAVDAVYIGLPNTLHREFVAKALKAGIHVLCDKPLAMREREAAGLVRLAARHSAHFMTAYRLHFEPANLTAIDLVGGGEIGRPRFFNADFAMQLRAGNIRTQKLMGGGVLHDLGIYCVNAARHLFGAEPLQVFAHAVRGTDRRFREVDEMLTVTLRFPDDRLAKFACSFGAADASVFQVWGSAGSIRLDEAFEMAGPKTLHLARRRGGKLKQQTREFAAVDQFAPLLLHFSDGILERRKPVPDGEEGAADLRVLDAIVTSARRGVAVDLPPTRFLGPRLALGNAMRIPAHPKPKLVQARGPSL